MAGGSGSARADFRRAATAAGLVLSGIATVRVTERGAALRRLVVTLVRLLSFRRAVADLRAERAALEADVVAAVDRFRPADMVPMFPRAADGGG